jgi:threonine synthase
MKYKSTRGQVKNLHFKDAVMMGLSEDGGLIIPENIPSVCLDELKSCADESYESLALNIMQMFIEDISNSDLSNLVNNSYTTFEDKDIIPVVKKGNIYIAELFHGPTYAFKDVALQFLGNLFEFILKESDEKMNILGATSGDTGSAAIYGVKGKENINIFILHPAGKVSAVQEMQMTTVDSKNVFNLSVNGTFDDCQYIVKELFSDLDFKARYKLGAVNSINWARILAQIVYYFYIYFKVTGDAFEGKKVRFAVPTGNFGNILAGYYAKMMGLPIDKLILATNENNILYRLVQNGDYSIENVVETYSPSMDIQLSSNLERYLYYLFEENPDILNKKMDELKREKRIIFSENQIKQIQKDFISAYTTNNETLTTIRDFYKETGYILDPHTACGINAIKVCSGDKYVTDICLATAHPAKFPEAVSKAIGFMPEEPAGIKQLKHLKKNSIEIQNDTTKVKEFIENTLRD